MGQVAELAVHRDEVLGLGDRQQRLELALHGVAGDVHVGQAGVHDLGAQAVQPVDDLADVASRCRGWRAS